MSIEALDIARQILDHQPSRHGWGYSPNILKVARAYLALSGGTGDVRSALLEAARRIEDSLPGLPDENDAHFIARALLAIPNGELKNFRGYAPSVPPDDAREAAHEIISDLLSMCDVSNWDADDGYRDLEYSIRHEVYERLHDFAADWQQRIGARSLSPAPKDREGTKDD